MYASQEVQVFSSFRGPETDFRDLEDSQLTSALTRCNNSFQETISTVYEVKHQKTVNTKIGERTNWFLEVRKEKIHHAFRKRYTGRRKKEIRVALRC